MFFKNFNINSINMLVILDLGAHDGCSIKKFKKILEDQQIKNYKIYSFEGNHFFKDKLIQYQDDNVEIIMKLINTHNLKTKLYISQYGDNPGGGSSLYSDKETWGVSKNKFIECDSIDIVEFINSLEDYDELWVKMDVEGAEYEIIPHLKKFNCLQKINKLFIEWHASKIPSISKKTHNQVKKMVKNIDTQDWCALEFSDQSKNLWKQYNKFLKNIN